MLEEEKQQVQEYEQTSRSASKNTIGSRVQKDTNFVCFGLKRKVHVKLHQDFLTDGRNQPLPNAGKM